MPVVARASLRLWRRRLAYRLRKLASARRARNTAAITKWEKLVVEARKRVRLREHQLARPLRISLHGVHFIERFEGFSARVYDDGVGVRTIGYGTTSADVSPLPTSITKQHAETLLKRKLAEKYEPAVRKAAGQHRLNQHQYDALVSLAYNLGPGILEASHTVGASLRRGDLEQVADDILLYDNPNDPAVHAGLKRRRQAERELYLHGHYGG